MLLNSGIEVRELHAQNSRTNRQPCQEARPKDSSTSERWRNSCPQRPKDNRTTPRFGSKISGVEQRVELKSNSTASLKAHSIHFYEECFLDNACTHGDCAG